MHWPKVDLKIRLHFKNSKIRPQLQITPKIEKRKIIWFNPPFSLNASTNIGKKVFSLFGEHFPKMHQLHKLFNCNNVKVSYSSLPNFGSLINHQNKNILTPCPLKGRCQHKYVVRFCKFSTPDLKQNHPHYIGLTEHRFKDRLYKHNNSCKYESKRNSAELYNFIWVKRKRRLMWILIGAF